MAFASHNLMRLKYRFANTKAHLDKLNAHATGKSSDNPTQLMRDIAKVVKDSIVETYREQYSTNPLSVAARTFSLEKSLDYFYVKKVNNNTVYMAVTRSWLWPLGAGTYLGAGEYYGRDLHYAEILEEGGVGTVLTPDGRWLSVHIEARHFILAGRMALENYGPAARVAAYNRWIE